MHALASQYEKHVVRHSLACVSSITLSSVFSFYLEVFLLRQRFYECVCRHSLLTSHALYFL